MHEHKNNSNASSVSETLPPTLCKLRTGRRPVMDRVSAPEGLSIGQYLISRLADYGIQHVFGLPGDYVLAFYSMLEHSEIKLVSCTREDCAGFAADAYARVHGMGAVCVTYGVGGLSLANSIAGAYAEQSPVIVISGATGLKERVNNPLLHHRVRDWSTQLDVFDKLCAASLELNDPVTAFRDIDYALDIAHRFKRPVYLEVPRDMVDVVPEHSRNFAPPPIESDPEALAEAIREATARIEKAKQPVIVAGVELHRYGLQGETLALANATGIPITASMLAKSVISETHPLYLGLYEGAMGREQISSFVEQSDCVILLGTMLTDVNLGIFTAKLNLANSILATSEELRISHHHFHNVLIEDFIQGLAESCPKARKQTLPPGPSVAREPFILEKDRLITTTRLVRRLDESLDDKTIVIADVGDALFASSELVIRGQTEFLSPAYYTSMGFAVPAAIGAKMARPDLKTIVLVGDGAFQMTGMELSTIIKHRLAATIIVLDNGGYGTERLIHEGRFNDINVWQYQMLPQVLGGGKGYEVRTEGEFDKALTAAQSNETEVNLIRVHIGREDHSLTLDRLGAGLAKIVHS
ncbi:MAG: thiamine pyrophosphate-binding protein [Planctomycetota bacterium]|nr:thiamine pyrophosphate-binding protein [Planctomycetota bacterium]